MASRRAEEIANELGSRPLVRGLPLEEWRATAGEAADPALADVDPFARLDDLPRMRDLYLAGADPTQSLASPPFADLADLPPTLVVVGDTETLLDDSTRFVPRAAAAGAPARIEIVPGAFHTWMGYPDLPEAGAALEVIGPFFRRAAPA